MSDVDMTEERYLTVQQAAQALGVSRATIWRLARAGELPGAMKDPLDGRAQMIPVSALQALLRRSAQYARRAAEKGRASGPKVMLVA